MKMNPFCMCCAVNKQEKNIRKFSDMEKKTSYMKKVMETIATAEGDDCAPSISVKLKKLYREFWGEAAEDYSEEKRKFNRIMLDLEASVEQKIRRADDPLAAALQYARTGNYIDFAALKNVSPDTLLSLLEGEHMEALDSAEYRYFLDDLKSARRLVYLTDNCGEVVLDKLAVRILKEQYPDLEVTVIVRGFPVINDATLEDAEEVGLTSAARVIGNGSDVPGTWLSGISGEARELLNQADLILAKGQGNFETLNESGLNIYYLFLCKCEWFQIRFHAAPLQGMFVNERRISSAVK